MKSYHIRCPKCKNNSSFYRYGKDSNGYQKYLCRNCCHQFAPERPMPEGANCRRKHPPCPVCGRASFLHHDYEHYSNYRCTDKKVQSFLSDEGHADETVVKIAGVTHYIRFIIDSKTSFVIGFHLSPAPGFFSGCFSVQRSR